ncbi:T6SS immunity protein Tli3 family protein [Rahnella selenatireducens]|uniref:T6SS immunity protein Tli3 family protein n=1 Tax=Rahnella selenatireducens TaxID=3389797 RepID=UPI0039696824
MLVARKISFVLSCFILMACDQQTDNAIHAPAQVVYRFDDHRYLELEGFNCEGALWFVDQKMKIRTEVVEKNNPIFRISFFKYIHPSQKYISIPWDDLSGFLISKDYGRTFEGARFSPGGGAVSGGASGPEKNDIESFTVVNDQAFIFTKKQELYLSSKPFGERWGEDYASLRAIEDQRHGYKMTFSEAKNFQGLPHQVPEIKNYTGWDHMHCDPDLGLPSVKAKK